MSNRISITEDQKSGINKVRKLYDYADFAEAAAQIVNTGISRKFALKKYSDKQDEKPAKKQSKKKSGEKKSKKSRDMKAAADRPKKSKKKSGEKKPKKAKPEQAEESSETISLN